MLFRSRLRQPDRPGGRQSQHDVGETARIGGRFHVAAVSLAEVFSDAADKARPQRRVFLFKRSVSYQHKAAKKCAGFLACHWATRSLPFASLRAIRRLRGSQAAISN